MAHDLDIAIIGAGAAGLTAAIFAGRAAKDRGVSLRIAALDGAKKLGAKILVSGGGRCNVTHDVVTPDDFNGANRNQVAKVLRSFDVPATTDWFRELGVELKREPTGKLFPTSDYAQTVLDALLRAAENAGVSLLTDYRVLHVARDGEGFRLKLWDKELTAARVILATGGKSLPRTGSDGEGYEFAKALGHTVTRTTPALVPLVLPDAHWLSRLTGISVDAELILATSTGKVLRRDRGSMLFTHFGLSGPLVMDISRHWIAATEDGHSPKLATSFLPGHEFADTDEMLLLAARERPKATVGATLRTLLPARVAEALAAEAARVPADTPMSKLTKEQRRTLVHALIALPLPVVRDRGYLFAEVTAGGVPLNEVDVSTMGSRVCAGLFLCGEILDIDGRIGGYNFQWAWASGRLAGMAAAAAN